jgi:death-on-curing protein
LQSDEPEWLSLPMLVAIHDEQLVIHGGAGGVRDMALLESALDRRRNKWAYEKAALPELAAAYGFGLAKNHPFVDGNKRTSLLAIYTFLGVNGVDFVVPEADAAAMILGLAAGEVSEQNLARWIRDNWPKQSAGALSYFTFFFAQSSITLAMARLFFSIITMWPLPWMPAFCSGSHSVFMPAWFRYFTVQWS